MRVNQLLARDYIFSHMRERYENRGVARENRTPVY